MPSPAGGAGAPRARWLLRAAAGRYVRDVASRGGGESVRDCHRRGRRPSRRSPAPGAAGRDPGAEGGREEAGSTRGPARSQSQVPAPPGGTRRPQVWWQEAAGRARRPSRRGGASPVPGRSQPPAGEPAGPAAIRLAESRWRCGARPSHALLQQIRPPGLPLPSGPQPKGSRTGLGSASTRRSVPLRARSRHSPLECKPHVYEVKTLRPRELQELTLPSSGS
ncbi:uncharacterized protein RBU33_017996 [Hipposideros larvatus]